MSEFQLFGERIWQSIYSTSTRKVYFAAPPAVIFAENGKKENSKVKRRPKIP